MTPTNPPTDSDRDLLHVVTFSGGKDSVATWLHLERDRGLRVQCVYADTGWEADELYPYLDLLVKEHGCPLVRIKPQVRDAYYDRNIPTGMSEEEASQEIDMEWLVKFKQRPPSPTKRFCTSILKLAPLRRYVQSIEGRMLLCCGVRAQESAKRAAMVPQCYDDFMGRERDFPIFTWTVEQVFDLHKKYSVPINPLYLKGCSRVGCYPCINARKGDIAVVAADPNARRRLYQIEALTGKTWFAPGTASKAYQSTVDPKSGTRINTAEDVIRWATDQQPQMKSDGMFAGQEVPIEYDDGAESGVCLSVYGLCE